MQKKTSPDSVTSATSSEPERRRQLVEDTDAHFQMLQVQISTFQRKVQVGVVGGNKLKQYCPKSATREKIRELRNRLEELKTAREGLSEPESAPTAVAPR